MDLLAFERKLDQTIMRKRVDIQEALKRPMKVRTGNRGWGGARTPLLEGLKRYSYINIIIIKFLKNVCVCIFIYNYIMHVFMAIFV